MSITAIDKNFWVLISDTSSYCLGITKDGYLVNTYFGPSMPFEKDYPRPMDFQPLSSFDSEFEIMPEEYPLPGKMKFVEPCVQIIFPNGVRDLDMEVTGHEIIVEKDLLKIFLKDRNFSFYITLHIQVLPGGVFKKWATLRSDVMGIVSFDRIFSGQIILPGQANYSINHLWGQWNDEMRLAEEKIVEGKKVLESRRLTSSHQHNPAFLFSKDNLTETTGRSIFLLLAWSGNWKLVAEKNNHGLTRISLGINDFDFEWSMKQGEEFSTPEMYFGMAQHGKGDCSRRLHQFIHKELTPHPGHLRKVLYNSWEATQFEVNIDQQKELAKIAAEIGVELFVLDDGWFSTRKSDNSGLGDWWVDREKFPNGLQELSEHVHSLGMDFGLWIEPEMVNPDSELYRSHPDWILHFQGRKATLARNQMILNLAIPDVREYLFERISQVLDETQVDFVKWDMNRNVSEPGWCLERTDNPQGIWVAYVRGLYALWTKFRERYPDIIWQSCSGGGGRIDAGILKFVDQVWLSDNTSPDRRIDMQNAFSIFYPACLMESWVTEMGDQFLGIDFRFLVSMTGVLGIGSNLRKWTAKERGTAKNWIGHYKEIRDLVQFGNQFRLLTDISGPYDAVQYLSMEKERGVVFLFRRYSSYPLERARIQLQGLDHEDLYEIPELKKIQSGSAWMEIGFQTELKNFEGRLLHLKKIG